MKKTLERMGAIMKELRGVEKTRKNDHGNFMYAGHQDLNTALRPLFVEHGLVQTVSASDAQALPGGAFMMLVTVRWQCVDDPADCIDMCMPAIQGSTNSKGSLDAKQVGQALSYAVKNIQFKSFMLTDSNEPDPDSNEGDSSRAANMRTAAPAADPKLKERAVACLAGFGECRTLADLQVYKEKWAAQEAWDTVKGYPSFRDQFKAAYVKAKARFQPVPIT